MNREHYKLFAVTFIPISANVISKIFDCAELTFVNQGTQSVTINQSLRLNPGQSITIPAYPGEMNIQAYDFVFTNPRAQGAYLVAICKNFVTHGK